MARLYSNENFPLQVVRRLREHGHDVVTMRDRGVVGQRVSDLDVLRFAIEEDRAVLTYNRRDFVRLHQQHSAHAGIVVCSVDSDDDALANRIHAILESNADLRGQLLRVNRPSR